jgi:hypothetical protein
MKAEKFIQQKIVDSLVSKECLDSLDAHFWDPSLIQPIWAIEQSKTIGIYFCRSIHFLMRFTNLSKHHCLLLSSACTPKISYKNSFLLSSRRHFSKEIYFYNARYLSRKK